MTENTGLNIEIYENVFTAPGDIFEKLEQEIQYLPPEQSCICIKDKVCQLPRQLVAFGDPGLNYTFTGLTVSCQPWTPLLLEIKNAVEQVSKCSYNFVLINRYRDGDDCIGQHKDNEYDLAKGYPISSVSLGEVRKMVFKRPNFTDYSLELKNNSMIIMKAPTNILWTHGIPRQRERKGIRVNLTFRKMVTCNKRKNEDTLSETSKKEKKESRFSGTFNDIPDNVFPLGDDVFVAISCIRGEPQIHIRRYKKYDKTYYPTKEGVTLTPWWFDHLFLRPIPESQDKLDSALSLMSDEFKVESTDFTRFILSRNITSKYNETYSRSIVIMLNQWKEIKKRLGDILSIALDYIFRDVDFKMAFKMLEDNVLPECLPESLDVSKGTEYITQLLFSAICDLIKEKNGLSTPMIYDDNTVVTSNSVTDFNTAAIDLHASEIANLFRENLWSNQRFLALPPAHYVTLDFLKSIRLDELIRKARNDLCPPCFE